MYIVYFGAESLGREPHPIFLIHEDKIDDRGLLFNRVCRNVYMGSRLSWEMDLYECMTLSYQRRIVGSFVLYPLPSPSSY